MLVGGVYPFEEGTDSRLLGVRGSQLTERGMAVEAGDCSPDEYRGLAFPCEYVVDVGVLYPLGECPPTV